MCHNKPRANLILKVALHTVTFELEPKIYGYVLIRTENIIETTVCRAHRRIVYGYGYGYETPTSILGRSSEPRTRKRDEERYASTADRYMHDNKHGHTDMQT